LIADCRSGGFCNPRTTSAIRVDEEALMGATESFDALEKKTGMRAISGG
jgi:hypothetical protein